MGCMMKVTLFYYKPSELEAQSYFNEKNHVGVLFFIKSQYATWAIQPKVRTLAVVFVMSDPYANLFDDLLPDKPEAPRGPVALPVDAFPIEKQEEPLDAILAMCRELKFKGELFSTILTETRAIDHEEEAKQASALLNLLFVQDRKFRKGTLLAEKAHYGTLQQKFTIIIETMKIMATDHWQIVKRFNADIDKYYYSIEKTNEQVKHDVEDAVDQINLQRRILSNAARDLNILEDALKATEMRLKDYVDAGGINNLSEAELALMRLNREDLTSGTKHAFNYNFFAMNIIDKVAIRLGIYLKETTNQYAKHLSRVFDNI
jgi:hypothetical protein